MKSSPFEQQIGIFSYYTKAAGVGGKLRTIPEDFDVSELFSYPPHDQDGRFTIAEVSCRNWETHTLVQEIADRLHISRKRIDFAGTKDRRATTLQLMSFFQVPPENLSKLQIKDVAFHNIYTSNNPVRIGELLGNRFDITLRNISASITQIQIEEILTPLNELGGFPNFYGIQRFGVIRPITHRVGQLLIQGDFEATVMMYLGNPCPGESEETYAVRQELEKTHDFQQGLKNYPISLNFERTMLAVLAQNSNDFLSALKALPKNLLMMFVNAYQSYLFNQLLSERLMEKIPLNIAVLGDIVFPVRNHQVDAEYPISVTPTNIEKVNKQLSKKKAVVTGLLLGSTSRCAEGAMGDIERKVIEQEHIEPRKFIIPEIPFLSSSGSRRGLLAHLDTPVWTLDPDTLHEQQQALHLQFQLQKGCYATCLLRELMKSKDPRDY